MPTLTDTHLVILSAAAQREDGTVLPLPRSLKVKGAAVTKTLDGLRQQGLLEERPAASDTEVWREAENGRRMMLVITDAGRQAIDSGPDRRSSKPATAPKAQTRKRRGRTASKPATAKSKDGQFAPAVRQGTKQALLIELLKRKTGTTIDEIVDATGWQPHSVRGAISGALKKKLGLTVTSEPTEKRGRVYRIVERS